MKTKSLLRGLQKGGALTVSSHEDVDGAAGNGASAKNMASIWAAYRGKIRAVGKVSRAFQHNLPDTAAVFSSFLPRMLQSELIENSERGTGVELQFTGGGRSVTAAVMFSDASGFTQVRATRRHLRPFCSLIAFAAAPTACATRVVARRACSQLTEKLAQQPNGAEAMCAIMNAYLTLMIETISAVPHASAPQTRTRTHAHTPRCRAPRTALLVVCAAERAMFRARAAASRAWCSVARQHGGDVIKFAGDALLVVFPIDTTGRQAGAFPDAKTAALQATCCAQTLATSLYKWKALDDP